MLASDMVRLWAKIRSSKSSCLEDEEPGFQCCKLFHFAEPASTSAKGRVLDEFTV